MSFAEKWKQMKTKYETAVKEKKPSEKWFGQFRKSTGIESACKELDTAIEKGVRVESEKALAKLKTAGEAYLVTLEKVMQTELPAVKQIRTSGLKVSLDGMLTEAHNKIKGMDQGVFDQVLGPDIMTRVIGLKFPKDAFVKSFLTDASFTKSYATGQVSEAVAKIRQDFVNEYNTSNSAYLLFLANRGKTMFKSQILREAKAKLEEMMVHSGREGMLGLLRTWEYKQVEETKGQKDIIEKFKKSTPYQVLTNIGTVLNTDAEKLNAAIAKAETIKL